ncbi:spermidine/putrescine ABC transporter permease PotB, partial [Vibrio alginolyticus]|nr:spermidine/putrescine ABC transporter permease PotB [Vibrio alginolyticus]
AATSIFLTAAMGLLLYVYYRAAKMLNKKGELE